MSESSDNDKNNVDFSWGKRKGRAKGKDIQFYDSFRYDGVMYSLFDCAYFYKDGETEPPYVGKLLKIWEVEKKQKKVKVLWFFHPSEISNYLEGVDVLENELFLASGKGKGLCNINLLETIAGKCNVVCISKDERNRQPLVEEFKMAHYVFYRTFNVDSLAISDKLDETIAEVGVKLLLNKNDVEPVELAKLDNGDVAADVQNQLVSVKEVLVTDKLILKDGKGAKDELEQSKCVPLQGNDTAGPDTDVMLMGLEKKTFSDAYTVGGNGDLTQDTVVGSFLVKNDKGLKQNGDTAKAGKTVNVALPEADAGLNSGQKTYTKSLGTKKVDKSDLDVAVSVIEKSKTVSQVKRAVSGVGKDVSESRPTKMLKLNGTIQKSIGVDGAGTPKAAHALHASNENVQPDGCAVNDGGNFGGQLGGVKDGLLSKQTSNDMIGGKSDDKLIKVPVNYSKHPDNSANRGSQHPVGAVECSDRGKLSKGLDVTSHITNQKPSGTGGAGTLKVVSASLACNETAQPADCAADVSTGTKLGGITNCLPRKQLPNKVVEENLDVKVHKASINQFKDGESSANRISKRPASATSDNLSNKRNSIVSAEDKPYEKKGKVQQSKDLVSRAYGNVKEVTTRPPDRSKWFTASPWEDRLKEAHDQEKLVFLLNLDPTYNSSDVENIIWHGLEESCTARVLQHTATSSRHSGQAFAIFKTPEIAQKVLMKLDQDCLMLPNGRPLVGCVRALKFPVKQPPYFGHLVLDKIKQQMQKDSREAVSTSHSSQSNTLEYEMALEWRLLQERADLWWKRLYKKQGEDMKKLKASMKSK